jgi:hypothetical protein
MKKHTRARGQAVNRRESHYFIYKRGASSTPSAEQAKAKRVFSASPRSRAAWVDHVIVQSCLSLSSLFLLSVFFRAGCECAARSGSCCSRGCVYVVGVFVSFVRCLGVVVWRSVFSVAFLGSQFFLFFLSGKRAYLMSALMHRRRRR